MNEESCFVTLTYNEENKPKYGFLNKEHLQKYIRSLRKKNPKRDIRYFAVGEYGDKSGRPHYHLCLFGISDQTKEGKKDITNSWRKIRSQFKCYKPGYIRDRGFVQIGTLTKDSAQYVAGYVQKKLTNKNDPYAAWKLGQCPPEFAIMSKKPGIGAKFADAYASKLLKNEHGWKILEKTNGDSPDKMFIGSKQYPIDRYLKNRIRQEYGISEETRLENLKKVALEVQRVSKAEKNNIKKYKKYEKKTPQGLIYEIHKGRRESVIKKSKIYRKRVSI
jgi:hypothetical protein